ncbi:MAG TPA: beta-ketoacyl-[acyl-carrier-protein] synthase II [Dehalococcoidia bacterium]|nr:beta-ketoacyl-[acyl-carrier-protein] synthase II [Dehalococcoidia bacterium]
MAERVFVTGYGAVSPVGLTSKNTWDNLCEGVSGVDYITTFDTEGYETTFAAEVTDFDPDQYVGRKQARRMDRFVQLAAASSLEALEHSGIQVNSSNSNRISVMISSGIGGIITLSSQIGVLDNRGPSRVSPFLVPMMLPDMASGQVSILTGAKGANYSTISACASGTDSIGMAFEAIRRGDVDVVIAGAAEAAICPVGVAGFSACQALSKRNDDPRTASRPFDTGRDGFVLGEGAGILIVENQSSMEKRGGTPIAELVGYGSTADAHHITQPGPEGEGGARAMNKALSQAEIQPEEVDYINAHGTSTPLNDKFETMAMKTVFGEYAYQVNISSTKSMTGHLLGASGALEAVVSVMAIENGTIPPTINLEQPDPECDLNYTPNKKLDKRINTSMNNSFGFGGHNASLIFQKVS